jgi:hypothetical protein
VQAIAHPIGFRRWTIDDRRRFIVDRLSSIVRQTRIEDVVLEHQKATYFLIAG